MPDPQHDLQTTRAVIRRLDERLQPEQRRAVVEWAQQMLRIRDEPGAPLRKARRALEATYRSDVVVAVLSTTVGTVRQIAWSDRSWSARLGLGAAAVTLTTLGGKGAGIAAMGGAVGVPLWMVLGAGGSFAGMLVDELSKARSPKPRVETADHGIEIVDAEWEPLDGPDVPSSSFRVVPASDQRQAREPLWRVFQRAYRDARARQRQTNHDE